MKSHCIKKKKPCDDSTEILLFSSEKRKLKKKTGRAWHWIVWGALFIYLHLTPWGCPTTLTVVKPAVGLSYMDRICA